VNPNDPLTYPEDAQNLKDMVHGIHSSGFRTRDYQHVRGGREGYYNWSEVTFPRGASTANCTLCHDGDSYEIPLDEDVLATTVRTTSVEDGNDPDNAAVEGAFQNVPNQMGEHPDGVRLRLLPHLGRGRQPHEAERRLPQHSEVRRLRS
jgi:hypothetical protein